MRAFQWYLGGGLGPILEPKPANLPLWPSCGCQLQFLPPTKNKFISSSADPAQCWNDTINLFMVWTLCLCIVLVPGVVGWWCCVLTTWHHVWRQFCQSKDGCIGGLFAPPPSTFWRRPDIPCWSGVAAGTAQAQYWLLHSGQRQGGRYESARCVDDRSCTK